MPLISVIPTGAERSEPLISVIPTEAKRQRAKWRNLALRFSPPFPPTSVIPTGAERSERSGGTLCLARRKPSCPRP